jgi:hypothetical protein
MMFSYLPSLLAATMFAMQAAPAAPARPAAPKKAATTPPITLTGCVSPDAAAPGSYTFSDTKTGTKYRLSGADLQKDAGKRQEAAVGSGAWRVVIRGGLVPSANVAAQAGAIDPSKAAIASATNGTNSGAASMPLPEFHVTRVQPTNGACP